MKTNKANQVAAFEKLLSYCNAQSAVYKPSKVSIQLAALNTLHTQTLQTMKAADVSRTAYENAVNARAPVLKALPKVVSRVVDAFIASGVSSEAVDDVKAIRRRFNSRNRILVSGSNPAGTPAPENPDQRPVRYRSHLDVATKIENFEKLVNRVSTEPLYKPNEADLTVAALTTLAASLRTLNRNVINAYVSMTNANRALNTLLYASTGIYGCATMAKAYLRSLFGRVSAQYKEVAGYEFKKR